MLQEERHALNILKNIDEFPYYSPPNEEGVDDMEEYQHKTPDEVMAIIRKKKAAE